METEVRAECVASEMAKIDGVPIMRRKLRLEYWMARVRSLNAELDAALRESALHE
jgi:hypothetical protein